jgi:hypothetical protein
MHGMQKIVNLMKINTEFSADSLFIDIGCGLGKPNLYVAQDPGVCFSYGIEVERERYNLGINNLHFVLKEAEVNQEIGTNLSMRHGDILDAHTLDPFTHVYQFDIGFPPPLLEGLAKRFNRSQSQYLISFFNPKKIIDVYRFDVELIATQKSTSMHGSTESHKGYIYKRNTPAINDTVIPCDPLFKDAWHQTGYQTKRYFERRGLPHDLINEISSFAPSPFEILKESVEKERKRFLAFKPTRKRKSPRRLGFDD